MLNKVQKKKATESSISSIPFNFNLKFCTMHITSKKINHDVKITRKKLNGADEKLLVDPRISRQISS